MSKNKKDKNEGYVGRGALKLKHAIEQFNPNIKDKIAADLGSSTGGFVEVLLKNGVRRVYAIDTAYGQLEWKLRNNERVVVMERINALHAELPEKVDFVTIDAGWTTQALIIPRAVEMLRPGGQIISLVKPHYEARNYGIRFKGGKLIESDSEKILKLVINDLNNFGVKVREFIKSPIVGGKGGNIEYLIWIRIGKNN